MNRRGQSAIEYLPTYGWALLAIIIIGAALVNTGVFSEETRENYMVVKTNAELQYEVQKLQRKMEILEHEGDLSDGLNQRKVWPENRSIGRVNTSCEPGMRVNINREYVGWCHVSGEYVELFEPDAYIYQPVEDISVFAEWRDWEER